MEKPLTKRRKLEEEQAYRQIRNVVSDELGLRSLLDIQESAIWSVKKKKVCQENKVISIDDWKFQSQFLLTS